MSYIQWSREDINHIKVSLKRCNAQELADELGVAKRTMQEKIQEINMLQRVSRLAERVK